MREAMRLTRPTSVFPWSRTGAASPDWDHTRPYLADAGGTATGSASTTMAPTPSAAIPT